MRKENNYYQNENNAWGFTLRTSAEMPVYGRTIRDRFAASSLEYPVTLFIPWGVSPTRTDVNNYDEAALVQVMRYGTRLAQYGVPNEIMIMPADLYTTEINGDDPDRAAQYLSALDDLITDLSTTYDIEPFVNPWSKIREQNREQYESILRYECSLDALLRSTPKALWYTGLLPASMSRNAAQGEAEIGKAAFRYLQERIAEARIIEEVYRPVKLSMASKSKDDIVDRELPRVYLLEPNLRFPWLKGE